MKYKRVITALLLIVCAAAAGGTGFLYGQNRAARGTDMETGAVIYESQPEESTRIAVVNLDEGTGENGARINYAESLSRFPSSDFEYSSLEEARAGFENGTYGAYIIIPATFSQSVESINSTPAPSWLQYTVNPSYSGRTQYELLYNVVSYAESLNNSLSYMYIDNILAEFHAAQDGASTVMENDMWDRDAIVGIEAYDLVSLIQVPELTQAENTTEMLDITPYTQRNSELAQGIDEQYMQCVEEIQQEIQALGESGTNLAGILTEMSEAVAQIDITAGEDGTSIAETADAALAQSLGEYKADMAEVLAEEMGNMSEDIEYTAEKLEDSVSRYNSQMNGQVQSLLSQYQSALTEAAPELEVSENNDGGYEVRFRGEQNSPTLRFTLSEDSRISAEEELLKKITASLAEAENAKDTVSISMNVPESSPGAGDGRTVETEYEADRSVRTVLEGWDEEAQKLGYDSAAAFLEKYGNGSVAIHSGDVEITCEGSADELTQFIKNSLKGVGHDDYTAEEFKGIVYSEDGRPMEDPETGGIITVSALLSRQQEALKNTAEKIGETQNLEIQAIQNLVKSEYIAPVEENADRAEETFVQRNNAEKAEIAAYNEKLSAFSPQINSQFLTESSTEMTQNNMKMQEALSENNMAYMQYADQVFQTATENVTVLQQTIMDTKEDSDAAVAEGLNNAIEIKAQTSRENQEILAEFTQKLPYTRLGTAEYTQAYQFIADPVNTEEISQDGNGSKTASGAVQSQAKGLTGGENQGQSSAAMYIATGILAFILLLALILNAVMNRRRQ